MMTVNVSGHPPRGITTVRLANAARAAFRAARRTERGALSLRIASGSEIERLNRTYCGKNRPTDVLSFRNADVRAVRAGRAEQDWGDVVIAPSVAAREAKKRGIPLAEEVVRLAVHGTLHLLGFDHATARDERRMVRIQERAVRNAIPRA